MSRAGGSLQPDRLTCRWTGVIDHVPDEGSGGGDKGRSEMAQWMQRTLAASASVTTVAVLVSMVGAGSKWW